MVMAKYIIDISEEGEKLFDEVMEGINEQIKTAEKEGRKVPYMKTDKQGWLNRVVRDWIKSRAFHTRLAKYQKDMRDEIDKVKIVEGQE